MRAWDGFAKLTVAVPLVTPGARPEGRLIVAYGTPLNCGRSGSVTPVGRLLKNT